MTTASTTLKSWLIAAAIHVVTATSWVQMYWRWTTQWVGKKWPNVRTITETSSTEDRIELLDGAGGVLATHVYSALIPRKTPGVWNKRCNGNGESYVLKIMLPDVHDRNAYAAAEKMYQPLATNPFILFKAVLANGEKHVIQFRTQVRDYLVNGTRVDGALLTYLLQADGVILRAAVSEMHFMDKACKEVRVDAWRTWVTLDAETGYKLGGHLE